jgi:hypothetical protein
MARAAQTLVSNTAVEKMYVGDGTDSRRPRGTD